MSVAALARAKAHEGMEISAVAEADPTRLAIRSNQGDLNFAQLNARVNQLCHWLRGLGLNEGDSIALLCTNRQEFCEVRFAAHRTGLRLTPVNWHLTADEVAYIVSNSKAKVLFADANVNQSATHAHQQSNALIAQLAIGGVIEGFADYESTLAQHSSDDISQPCLGNTMLYTSGTTGRPKGVLRKQPDPNAAAAMQEILTMVFQFEPDSGKDKALVTGPLYHSGPFNLCMTTPLTAGIGIVIMEKWTPEEMLRLIQDEAITHTFCVPTMFNRLLAVDSATKEATNLETLRFVIHGAAPTAVSTKQKMMDWFGPIIWEMFAGTEGPGTIVSPHDWLQKPGTVGKPGEGQMIICDENGELLPKGSEGQIWVQNPANSQFEYFNEPDKTRAAQSIEGYFTAGDIGVIDEDGFLFITGRSAEVIIAGGVNLYPQEIDDVLIQHPDILDCACIGAPHADLGEQVVALIQLHEGVAQPSAQSIINFCDGKLARQKWPRIVEFKSVIPRSAAGKVLRKQLRDNYSSNQS